MFYVRHELGDRPPIIHLMRDLLENNPYDVWRRGEAAPHTVENILHASELYREALPKYRLIHRKLDFERCKVSTLRRALRRHRRSARKQVVTRSSLNENAANVLSLSDAEWSVAALEREEVATTDFLGALVEFIGVDEYNFDTDFDFDNE